MGNRALVVFTDRTGKNFSPVVYLHWHGDSVTGMLAELKTLMADRPNDHTYACARFIGIAATHIPGNLSLGTWNLPETIERDAGAPVKLGTAAYWKESSHGDAGVFLVNADTWKVKRYQ